MATLGLVGSPAFLAACGSDSDKKTASTGTKAGIETITLPFLEDMQVPDPDIFYEGEGVQLMLSVYDNLVRYTPVEADVPLSFQPVDKRIQPWLAESWEISPDGKTYTFHLKSGVKFHDGTDMTADSFVRAYDRRRKVDQGPAYMVKPVVSATAPDPLTFVVVLEHPIDPYLDYLACPWGPKPLSAKAMENEVDGDLAQKWFTTHDAGTGPYMITEFIPADHYTLEVFDGWWGEAPEVKKVIIPIIHDVQTQELKFKSGDIDIITKGLPIQDVDALAKDDKFSVSSFQTALTTAFFMNKTEGRIFANKELRAAVKGVIDREALTKEVYKGRYTTATQFFPSGTFPDGLLPDTPKTAVADLKKIVDRLPSKKIDIAYGESGGASHRLMGQLIQTQLQAGGLDVTVRSLPTSQEFELWQTPDDKRPDILLDLYGGDTLHVDTMLRIIFRTGAAPLNWFTFSYPEADALMDEAWKATDPKAAEDLYVKSATVIKDDAVLVNLANQSDIIVSRAGITNIVHDPMGFNIRIQELKSA